MIERKRNDATGKVPDRSPKTIELYRERGWKFVEQVRRELNDSQADLPKIVDVFLTSDGRYKPASQRAIKAWLMQIIEDSLASGPADIKLKESLWQLHAGCGPILVARLRDGLGPQSNSIEQLTDAFLTGGRQFTERTQDRVVETLQSMIATSIANGNLRPEDGERLTDAIKNHAPHPKRGPRAKSTSSKKRKECPPEELQSLTRYLSGTRNPMNGAAAKFLRLNVFFGLRPGEWRSAHLIDNTIHWKAEKTTNGRGNSEDPALTVNPALLATLRSFLDFLQPYRGDEKQWERLFERLRSRIAYACKKLGIRRIALYTTRDVFIATELLSGTDPTELAAKVNHKSVRTHRRHYASKRSGYNLSYSLTSIDSQLVATVTAVEPFSINKVRGLPRRSM